MDMTRVAAVGFSWGGLSNIIAAAKDTRIEALVSMDGAVRHYNPLMVQAKYAVPEKLTTPLLFLVQTPASMETNIRIMEDMSGSFISRMTKADLCLLTMYPMDHVHFGSAYIRFDDPAEYKEYTAAEVSAAYSLGARVTIQPLRHWHDALPGAPSGRPPPSATGESINLPRKSSSACAASPLLLPALPPSALLTPISCKALAIALMKTSACAGAAPLWAPEQPVLPVAAAL